MNEVETVEHLKKVIKSHLKGKTPKISYEPGWCGGAVSFVHKGTRVILRYSSRRRTYYACYDYIQNGQILMRRGGTSKKPFVIFKKIGKWDGWRSKSSRYRRPTQKPRQ